MPQQTKKFSATKVTFVVYAKREFSHDDKKFYKVRDHCHYTGKYGGAEHMEVL